MVNSATLQVEATQPAVTQTAGLTPDTARYFQEMMAAVDRALLPGAIGGPDYVGDRRQMRHVKTNLRRH